MNAWLVPRLMRALLLVVALGLGACSSFEREWRESQARGISSGDPFAGAWDGKWISSRHGPPANRFGGRLRCIFTPLERLPSTTLPPSRSVMAGWIPDRNAKQYRAHFKANWHGFATTYHVVFHTERRGGELRFRGEHDLGPLAGGIYRYDGRVTRTRFVSTYDSSYDTGRFEMTRPRPGAVR